MFHISSSALDALNVKIIYERNLFFELPHADISPCNRETMYVQ